MVMTETIDILARREAIRRVLINYCRGVDRKDWDLVLECFHGDAVDLHGAVEGSAADLVAWTQAKHERVGQSMHALTNVAFLDETPTSVVTESYCSVNQLIERSNKEPAHLSVGCRYIDMFDCRQGDWRIARRRVVYEWVRHEAVARDLLATDPTLSRSLRTSNDVSYTVRVGQ
jgi:hypothetical protein